jgi:hypothetical protein
MSQSDASMSSFLAELAGEATQKLEAKRNLQQDRQEMMRRVHDALDRAIQFFTPFCKHLNAIEPAIPRHYVLDGKTRFSNLKWKSGMTSFRKQSLADDALLDHAYFQVRLTAPAPVETSRRWEKFGEFKDEVQAFGLKPMRDLEDMWRERNQQPMLNVTLEPEFILWIRWSGNYSDGTVEIQASNLDGFGRMKGRMAAESLQTATCEEIGRFLMGRVSALPGELGLQHELS